jgi:dTDP-4-amino-4,6-dideoxygalactose transaminase
LPNGTTLRLAAVEITDAEIDRVVKVLRSGNLRQGDVCREFEERFAQAVGARHAITVSSGTAALHLAWLALLAPGDEVLVPAFSFIATASSVLMAGGVAVFCDVDYRSGTIDVADARRRVGPRTRGIAPVHLYGGICDVAGVQQLASQHDLRIVWDSAQAHGTRLAGMNIGYLAEASCYSFYATKTMTTGEGGMIATNDDALAARLRLLRSHGETQRYLHTELGFNYRLTDLQAAIGLGQLERLVNNVGSRRRNAAFLSERLADLPGLSLPYERAGSEHAYHQYTIQVDPNIARVTRDDLARSLAASGIETAVHYPRPIHRQPLFAKGPTVNLPVSERLAERVLSLPIHHRLTTADLERIAAAVRSAVPAKSAA